MSTIDLKTVMFRLLKGAGASGTIYRVKAGAVNMRKARGVKALTRKSICPKIKY
jgi:hypothetical protein